MSATVHMTDDVSAAAQVLTELADAPSVRAAENRIAQLDADTLRTAAIYVLAQERDRARLGSAAPTDDEWPDDEEGADVA